MVEYNKINVKLSHPKLNKLKSAVKKMTKPNFKKWILKFLMKIIYLMNYY